MELENGTGFEFINENNAEKFEDALANFMDDHDPLEIISSSYQTNAIPLGGGEYMIIYTALIFYREYKTE